MNKFLISKNSFGKYLSQSRAGETWRLSLGASRCGNEDGPLHDLPDWRFADGRSAPITPSQAKWIRKRYKTKKTLEFMFRRAKEYKQKKEHVVLYKMNKIREKK